MSEVEGGGGPEGASEAERAEAEKFNEMVDKGILTPGEMSYGIKKNQTPQEVEIDRLVERTETFAWETNHAHLFGEMYFGNRECQQLVNDRLKDRRLIDLGSGQDASLWVPAVASRAGASDYIGVEKYHFPLFDYQREDGSYGSFRDSREIPNGQKAVGDTLRKVFGEELKDIDFQFVREDGLKFLAQQDKDSANIVINGVDENVIPPWRARNKQYLKRMIEEIDRVVGPDGVVMSYNSPFLSGLLDKGYEVREFERGKLKVYMKKKEQGKSDESK
jgi:hypothetical protein